VLSAQSGSPHVARQEMRIDFSAAPEGPARTNAFSEVLRSQSLTQKPTSPNDRLPLTAFETHSGRSIFAAGTALPAPLPSFAAGTPIGSSGWFADIRTGFLRELTKWSLLHRGIRCAKNLE
jgi:hypothetical protein